MVAIPDKVDIPNLKDVYGRQFGTMLEALDPDPTTGINVAPGQECTGKVTIAAYTAYNPIEGNLL
jgi:hypothetical protein